MNSSSAFSAPPRPPHPPEQPSATEDPGSAGSSDSQVRSLSVPSLLAGGAAAATTSVIGGQLGISGTVAGAAITSVLSAAVVAFYTDSVNGTARKLKQVTTKAGQRAQGRGAAGAVHTSRTRPGGDGATSDGGEGALDDAAAEARAVEAGVDDAGAVPSRGRRIAKIAAMSLVIALIGMAAVFGIQRLTGTELSPGTGEIQRSVTGTESVTPRGDTGGTTEDGTEQDGSGQGGTDQETGTTDPQQDGTGTDGTTDEGGTDGSTGEGTSTGDTTEQGEGTSGDGSSPGGDGGSTGGQDGGSTGSGSGSGSGTSSGSGGSSGSGSGSSSGSASGSGSDPGSGSAAGSGDTSARGVGTGADRTGTTTDEESPTAEPVD